MLDLPGTLSGPAGKIISMTNPAHDVLNVSGRQCQTSTDLKTPPAPSIAPFFLGARGKS